MTRSAPVALEAARELDDVDPAELEADRHHPRAADKSRSQPPPAVIKRVLAEWKRQGLSEYVQDISVLDRIAGTSGGEAASDHPCPCGGS